jgi:alkylation response protein AidB-like acyl-CoA dehydrogenase
VLRVNELLNWQVACAETVNVADASVTKVFSSEQAMRLGSLLYNLAGQYGDPADPATAELMEFLDVQIKRNTVLTFGGGVNEVQRELIASFGLGLERAPRLCRRPLRKRRPGSRRSETARRGWRGTR